MQGVMVTKYSIQQPRVPLLAVACSPAFDIGGYRMQDAQLMSRWPSKCNDNGFGYGENINESLPTNQCWKLCMFIQLRHQWSVVLGSHQATANCRTITRKQGVDSSIVDCIFVHEAKNYVFNCLRNDPCLKRGIN